MQNAPIAASSTKEAVAKSVWRAPRAIADGIPAQLEDASRATRARYTRRAPFYDSLESLSESRYRVWRELFWGEVAAHLSLGSRLLEVGVGTGANIPYWPAGLEITALDLTPAMLERAQRRARMLSFRPTFELGDVQSLGFPDGGFEAAAATFVFCSVPDPVRGLREVRRVIRPGGYLFLLEHVRAPQPLAGRIMDLLNPAVVRLTGANINRETLGNVLQAGFEVERVEGLGFNGMLKLVVARA